MKSMLSTGRTPSAQGGRPSSATVTGRVHSVLAWQAERTWGRTSSWQSASCIVDVSHNWGLIPFAVSLAVNELTGGAKSATYEGTFYVAGRH